LSGLEFGFLASEHRKVVAAKCFRLMYGALQLASTQLTYKMYSTTPRSYHYPGITTTTATLSRPTNCSYFCPRSFSRTEAIHAGRLETRYLRIEKREWAFDYDGKGEKTEIWTLPIDLTSGLGEGANCLGLITQILLL